MLRHFFWRSTEKKLGERERIIIENENEVALISEKREEDMHKGATGQYI